MTQKPWLVFGLDGRSPDEVETAVRLGYRRFDAAENYGTTTDDLASALSNSGLPRQDFEVLYKFDVRAQETRAELRDRLTKVAEQFDGRLDAVVIHNIDGDRAPILQAWQVLHAMKRDGLIGKAGVGNVLPRDADLLRELQSKSSVDVVELSPGNTPRGSEQGSAKGSDRGSDKGSPDRGSDRQSDRSSPRLGVVENPVRGVLADPQVQDMLSGLGDRTSLYYYNVVRTLDEIQRHYDRTGAGEPLNMKSTDGMTAIAQQAGYRVEGPASMILSSGNPRTMESNLAAYRTDPIDPAFVDYPPAGYDQAVGAWASYQEVCRSNDDTPLPDGVREKLVPLFEQADQLRPQAWEFAKGHGDGKVTRESLSNWLMQERGFTREELEGVTVPDRAGLLPAYQNMKLADVLAGQFGSQNCNYKWADQLATPLLNDVATWNAVAPGLSEIARDPASLRTPSPLSMAGAAAAVAPGATSPGRRSSDGSGQGVPPVQPVRTPSPARGR